MDEKAYVSTYREINTRFCAFEKGILTNQCRCSQSGRFFLAEREGVHCKNDQAQTQCLELLEILREQSRFALRTTRDQGVLPHAQAIRIQIGGLKGIQLALSIAEPDENISDVYELINQAKQEFDGLDNLPFPLLMQQISAYKGRQRVRKKD